MTGEQLWLFDTDYLTELEAEGKPKKEKVLPPHFENPRNDNERLLEYQFQHRQGNRKALGELYTLSVSVCMKFIATEAKRNGHIKVMPYSARQEKAHNASTYLVERILKDGDFAVTKSFTGYLYLRVKYELYHQSKADTIVDFVDFSTFHKEESEAFEGDNDWQDRL